MNKVFENSKLLFVVFLSLIGNICIACNYYVVGNIAEFVAKSEKFVCTTQHRRYIHPLHPLHNMQA